MTRETEIVSEYLRRKEAGESGIVPALAAEHGNVSRETIYLILRRAGHRRPPAAPKPAREPRPAPPKRQLRPPQRDNLARFIHYKPEPERVRELGAPTTRPWSRAARCSAAA